LQRGRFHSGVSEYACSRSSTCTDDLSWRPEPASARKIATVLLDHGAGEPSGCRCGRRCRCTVVDRLRCRRLEKAPSPGQKSTVVSPGWRRDEWCSSSAEHETERCCSYGPHAIFPEHVVGVLRMVLARAGSSDSGLRVRDAQVEDEDGLAPWGGICSVGSTRLLGRAGRRMGRHGWRRWRMGLHRRRM
jgi:hypothetical protein